MKTHGIMFHHFHGGTHPVGQGSIAADDLHEMLEWLRRNYRVLDASSFYEAAVSGELTEEDTCLTFDDSLLCQYEIAAPILADEGLTAFYFVYSSAFSDEPDMLEIYRYFRSTEYPDFDAFCDEFVSQARMQGGGAVDSALDRFDPDQYLAEFSFYSRNDRLFRYVRDRVLTSDQYSNVMAGLMQAHNFKIREVLPLLFMDASQLINLQNDGNIIGLHSHTHPTTMDTLSVANQRYEYRTNHAYLSSALGDEPTSMSHPCGRYTPDTLQILHDLGVRLGFRSSLSIPEAPSLLEIPRVDHSDVLARIRS